jgi:hypothetical protein
MKRLYLVLALVGAIAPYAFFLQYFSSEGLDITGFVSALFDNGAAAGFSADLLVTSLVFWVAMFHRQREGKGPNPIPFVLLNLLIGLSCAVPAYLYIREDRAS